MFTRILATIVTALGVNLKASSYTDLDTSEIPRNDMEQLKERMSAFAERIAKEGFGVQLDFSIESVKEVERILGAIHSEYMKAHSDDGLFGIALEFGAYIVKVIERHFGPANWERDDPEFGEDSFPLRWRDETIFPVGWCFKRILDGPGDDVWCKFDVLVVKHNPSE